MFSVLTFTSCCSNEAEQQEVKRKADGIVRIVSLYTNADNNYPGQGNVQLSFKEDYTKLEIEASKFRDTYGNGPAFFSGAPQNQLDIGYKSFKVAVDINNKEQAIKIVQLLLDHSPQNEVFRALYDSID